MPEASLELRADKERELIDSLDRDIVKLTNEHKFSREPEGFLLHLKNGVVAQVYGRQKKEAEERLASLNHKMQAEVSDPPRKTRRKDKAVQDRRALARQNRDLNIHDILELYHRARIPLPKKYENSGIKTWPELLVRKGWRGRVEPLISRDKNS